MAHYSIAEAKDNFSSLVGKVEAGEEVVITRRGVVVAELKPKSATIPQTDGDIWEDLRRFRQSQTPVSTSAVDIIRQMRDEGY